MSSQNSGRGQKAKGRVKHELEQFLVLALFLFFFFGSVTSYRHLVLAEYQISDFDYGWAAVKALVLAKVILIGEILHLGKRFEGRRVVVAIIGKTLVFGVFIAAFAVCEHLVSALVHHRAVHDEFRLTSRQGYELLARVQLEVVALLPLFAFKELGRVLGVGDVTEVLFRREPEGPVPKGRAPSHDSHSL